MGEAARHPDNLLPAKVAAERMGISVKSLRRLIVARLIGAKRHGNPARGGKPRMFILESELERYIKSMPNVAAPVKHRQHRERAYRNVSSDEIQFV